MPPDDAKARPVGNGREMPNRDPYIPEPNIPLQFTWWEVRRRWGGEAGTV